MSRWMDYRPAPLAAAGMRRTAARSARSRLQNVTVSNVPGPRKRGHVDGAAQHQFFPVGPLVAGTAMNVTVWSCVDQLNFSVLTDDSIVDPHVMTEAVVRELAVIRRAAGLPAALDASEPVTAALPGAGGQSASAATEPGPQ